MSVSRPDSSFQFVGERLCLDFVNTELIQNDGRVDLLGGFEDLLDWSVAAEILRPTQANEMSARWKAAPGGARVFAEARRFRQTLRAMVERVASGKATITRPALDAINDVLRARIGDLALVRTSDGYETLFLARWTGPEQLLVPIAESAAALLSDGDLSLVRKCENPACILYFYDTTKNHARRWCSMTACGNRAKVAAHYRRTRRRGTTD